MYGDSKHICITHIVVLDHLVSNVRTRTSLYDYFQRARISEISSL